MGEFRRAAFVDEAGNIIGITSTRDDPSPLIIDLPADADVNALMCKRWDGVAFVDLPQQYRTRLRPGEVMSLLGALAFAKLYRAAYPHGNKAEDDTALYFLEQAKRPYSQDGLIEVTDAEVVNALTYFRDHVPPYITDADMTRVLQGVPV